MGVHVDCLIIGGGPAGLTAATYLGRFRRNVLLVDSGDSRASWIPVTHNVLGFSQGVKGPDLLSSMRQQADLYGAERVSGQIVALKRQPNGSFLATWGDGEVSAAKVLIATGGLDVEPEIKDARAIVKAGLIRHCPICDCGLVHGGPMARHLHGLHTQHGVGERIGTVGPSRGGGGVERCSP
jgi:thioredoxin reductase (NADPH)